MFNLRKICTEKARLANVVVPGDASTIECAATFSVDHIVLVLRQLVNSSNRCSWASLCDLNLTSEKPRESATRWGQDENWANLTNNGTVELVIRRFDQHYQSFCGFESIDHAHSYLAVFEKVYRFTPFSPDAQPRIRNHCPLQLAGYDVSHLPMTTLCAGLSILWPLQSSEVAYVPNS